MAGVRAAIVFDFGGTLDYPAHWLDRFLRHYRSAGLELDRPTLDRAFTSATATAYCSWERICELNLDAIIRYLTDLQLAELRAGNDRLANLIDALGRERIAAAISRSFADESRASLAANREILRRLSGRYKLGVISNFYGNLERVLDESGLLPLFDFVGDSSRLGSFKPDPAIFHAALEALEVAAAAVLMVGDSLDKDCAPAKRLGMRTAWLRHRIASAEPDSISAADFTINGLAELEHLSWHS
jgi:HAD superfamily hydrolase (TIGR01509 family)